MLRHRFAAAALSVSLLVGATSCSTKTTTLFGPDIQAADATGLDYVTVAGLVEKPLYEMTEQEIDAYLGFAQARYPDLRERIVHLARKNVGQPYELYLLGEAPFEFYDPQPLYCIDRSDCVVFSEHTYAYAMSHDWPSFFTMLQRIRYKDGHIGVATRNHYTEADWDRNNSWLVRDVSRELAGEDANTYTQKVDRSKFLKKRYKLEADIPVETIEEDYIPLEKIADIEGELQSGDFVNFVRGKNGGKWVGHVGLVAVDEDGTVNVIHSTPPKVREEPLSVIVARSIESIPERQKEDKAIPHGFKFLRLADDPVANLRDIDGEAAPKVFVPGGTAIAQPLPGK